MKNLVKFTALAAAILATASVAHAQTTTLTGSINAKADVKSAITVSGTTDLDFGTVYRNQGGKTIAATAANSGVYAVGGPGATTATASLISPPTTLLGPSSATLPIGTWTLATTTGTAASCGTSITSGTAGNVAINGTAFTDGTATVCVGATVTPALTQPLGAYTGAVTLTVVFP